jgi:hypothetical protein
MAMDGKSRFRNMTNGVGDRLFLMVMELHIK